MHIELWIPMLAVSFGVLFVSVAFLERQRIQDFIAATPERPAIDSPYYRAMNEAARGMGFTPAGEFVQNRNSRTYQACLTLWVSPDGQTLLRVGGGKTAKAQIRRSSLISFVEPDKIIETTDEFGMADLSGMTDRKIIMNADLKELAAGHQMRLAQHSGAKRVFPADKALVACEAMQAMKVSQMQRLGLARFMNNDKAVWRYTLKGAWLSYAKGIRGQLAEAKTQMDRAKLKRPGAK